MKFEWTPTRDGDDIVYSTLASWFGGPADKEDNGETASGVPDHVYGVRGCALPVPVSNGIKVPGCQGSPLPALPYGLEVEISNGNFTVTVPFIDCGPDCDVGPDRGIDLTEWTFEAGLGHDLKDGLVPVHVRILGAAKYLPT